jgi:RNA-dependent RNA polymerase
MSTSIPVLEFDGGNMFYVEDIREFSSPMSFLTPIVFFSDSEDWTGPGNPPAEKVMTDGCGFMNGAALFTISKSRNLPNRPTAVQGRIAGAKGLWILHPSDRDPSGPPRIWIRRSQRKIDLGPFSELQRAHRIFDLVAPSRTNTPARLSIQVILNLNFNGVPAEAFESLMRDELQSEVKKLTDWSRPNAMAFLWFAINRAGNVGSVRVQRQALGAGRALGLTGRNYGRDEDEETDGDDEDPFDDSSFSGHKCYSGQPLTLHESALELVQSGFHPAENPLLYAKIKTILGRVTERLVKKFHYPVTRSVRAFMVPGMSTGSFATSRA